MADSRIEKARPTPTKSSADLDREAQVAILRAVKAKSAYERVALDAKKEQNTPQVWSDLVRNPMQAVRATAGFLDDLQAAHDEEIAALHHLELGVSVAETLMNRCGFDLGALDQMSVPALAKLCSLDAAIAIKDALRNPDVAKAKVRRFGVEGFSWSQNKSYASDEHLTTELGELGRRAGAEVHVARDFYRQQAKSADRTTRFIGETMDRGLDALSSAEHAGTEAIAVAGNFYAGVEGKAGTAGRAATAAGGLLYELLAAPARVVDEHIDDQARGEAMASAALAVLLGPAGAGPSVKIGILERGGAGIAAAISRSVAPLEPLAAPFVDMAKAFERSSVAQRIDRWRSPLRPQFFEAETPKSVTPPVDPPTLVNSSAPIVRSATKTEVGVAEDTLDLSAGFAPTPATARSATKTEVILAEDTLDLSATIDPRSITRPIPREATLTGPSSPPTAPTLRPAAKKLGSPRRVQEQRAPRAEVRRVAEKAQPELKVVIEQPKAPTTIPTLFESTRPGDPVQVQRLVDELNPPAAPSTAKTDPVLDQWLHLQRVKVRRPA